MIKSVAIYLLSSIVSRAIPFLILPVLVKVLSAEEYGEMVIFQAACGFAIPLIGLCLPVNISKLFYRKNGEDIPMAINIVIIMAVGNACVLLLLNYCFDMQIINKMLDQNTVPIIIVVGCAAAILQALQIIFRNLNQPKMFACIEIGVALIAYAISGLIIYYMNEGWVVFAYCYCLTNVGFCMIAWCWVKRHKIPLRIMKPKLEMMREMLWISVPFMPNLIGTMALSYFDRFIIGHYGGKSDVAVYSVGALLGMSVALITESVSKAWSPWVYKCLSTETENVKIKVAYGCVAYCTSVLFIPVVVYFLAGPAIQYLFPPEYHRAAEITFWVSIAATLQGAYFVFFPFYVHAGKTYYLSLLTFMSGILSIGLAYALVPVYGGLGAAYAKVFGFMILGAGVIIVSVKIYPMPWGKLTWSGFSQLFIQSDTSNRLR